MWQCRFNHQECGADFPCLSCIAHDLIADGKSAEANEILARFEFVRKDFPDFKVDTLFGPSAKVGATQGKPRGLPATPKQLAYIESLCRQRGIKAPYIDTLDEAKALIIELLEGTDADRPTEKQVSYLKSLAAAKLGPNSQDWVDSKIAKGKKEVSAAINQLKNMTDKR